MENQANITIMVNSGNWDSNLSRIPVIDNPQNLTPIKGIIYSKDIALEGTLNIPARAKGIVLFAHGSGSSRFSPRNQYVAKVLQQAGIATLLFDLLTADEEIIDEKTAEFRFNIPLLAERLLQATSWLAKQKALQKLNIGYFGSSTGAAAALISAARSTKKEKIKAIVSRGGRPELATGLKDVKAATLFIVGEYDKEVIAMNEEALQQLQCEKKMIIIPKATHLFEEQGALEQVAKHAAGWFLEHL